MVNHIIWITLVVTLQVSAVFCRNPYFEYFYSRYHEGHSTTESISSSTSDISSEEVARSSVSDTSLRETSASSSTGGSFSENRMHSSTVDHRTTSQSSISVLQYGDTFDDDDYQRFFAVRTGIIIGCFIFFVISSCCLFCCLRRFLRGRERRGFVMSTTQETATEVHSQQPVNTLQHQQPVPAQYYPPQYPNEHTHLVPPPYQPHAVQQQYLSVQPPYQYSATEHQSHNPPEAPPPYELPNKF